MRDSHASGAYHQALTDGKIRSEYAYEVAEKGCGDSGKVNGCNLQSNQGGKWECILNFYYDFPRTNVPYLESSEQLDRLFPASLHKIKFHIFQNISKC